MDATTGPFYKPVSVREREARPCKQASTANPPPATTTCHSVSVCVWICSERQAIFHNVHRSARLLAALARELRSFPAVCQDL